MSSSSPSFTNAAALFLTSIGLTVLHRTTDKTSEDGSDSSSPNSTSTGGCGGESNINNKKNRCGGNIETADPKTVLEFSTPIHSGENSASNSSKSGKSSLTNGHKKVDMPPSAAENAGMRWTNANMGRVVEG